MTRDDSIELKQMVQDVSIQYMHIGVSAGIVNNAIVAAGKSMGGMKNVTKDVVETISILNAQLGICCGRYCKNASKFCCILRDINGCSKKHGIFYTSLGVRSGS